MELPPSASFFFSPSPMNDFFRRKGTNSDRKKKYLGVQYLKIGAYNIRSKHEKCILSQEL